MKRLIVFFISLIMISYFAHFSPVNAQSISPTTGVIQNYIQEMRTIEQQIYYLGANTFSSTQTEEEKKEMAKLINFQIQNINRLQKDIENYIKTINPTATESRELNVLLIVLNYYKSALGELLFFMDSKDNYVKFDSLERYFYAKLISSQNLDWVERLLLTESN